MLDMGEPVRILDGRHGWSAPATRCRSSTPGCGRARSCTSSCSASGEVDERPAHPLISHVPVPPLDPRLASSIHAWAPRQTVVKELVEMSELRVDGQWSTLRHPLTAVDSVPAQRSSPPRITV